MITPEEDRATLRSWLAQAEKGNSTSITLLVEGTRDTGQEAEPRPGLVGTVTGPCPARCAPPGRWSMVAVPLTTLDAWLDAQERQKGVAP